MRTPVRAPRAYLAGFGTSGSLLAGAAVLFVLGSAIVAFRGWPQIATGRATTVVPAAQPTAPSRVARRLAVVLSRRTGVVVIATRRVRGASRHGAPRGGGAGRGGSGSGSGSGSQVAPGSSAPAAGASQSAPCSGSGCHQPGPADLLSTLTSTVAQEVSNAGASVGSQASNGSGTVAGAINGVNPPASNTVRSGGNSVGNTVSGTASTAGGLISQAGGGH